MKTRQIFSLLLATCILLYGCGTAHEKADVSQVEMQMDNSVEESVEENNRNGKGTEQTETAKEPAEVLKQNLLTAAGAQESDILLLDCDDYDGDGKYEAFMICGSAYDEYGTEKYKGRLFFAGADGSVYELEDDHGGYYRMIDGKMKFGSGRKYLFFYLDYNLTANISVIWTVEDGKPVEISESLQHGQVVYHGGDDFEIWIDTYDHYCMKDHYGKDDHMWTGHTWKPYFYHYNYSNDQLEAYTGEEISRETFKELSGTNIIEEIEAKGYTVGEIIRWENDIVTINYHYVRFWGEDDSEEEYTYEHVIWDNRVKDFWQKKTGEHIDSWEDAGVGGSYGIPYIAQPYK